MKKRHRLTHPVGRCHTSGGARRYRLAALPALLCATAACSCLLASPSVECHVAALSSLLGGGLAIGRPARGGVHRIPSRSFATWREPATSAACEGAGDLMPRRGAIGCAGLTSVGALQLLRPPAALAKGSASKEESFEDLTMRYRPEHPPVRSKSSPAEVALARHLKAVGAACYTAWWCPHCQDQREQFGAEAIPLAPFVQCSSKTGSQLDVCKEKDVEGYPMWIIGGEKYRGGRELSELANLTKFTEFPLDAFSERPDEVTDYIWGREENSTAVSDGDD